ncbi:hypothetical protein LXA43DRAFT_999635 [Ganoderma leucocontextum]|nr:hypothetical protein LXA43DRAFT_999635 [Ganoderma leucocontextum]
MLEDDEDAGGDGRTLVGRVGGLRRNVVAEPDGTWEIALLEAEALTLDIEGVERAGKAVILDAVEVEETVVLVDVVAESETAEVVLVDWAATQVTKNKVARAVDLLETMVEVLLNVVYGILLGVWLGRDACAIRVDVWGKLEGENGGIYTFRATTSALTWSIGSTSEIADLKKSRRFRSPMWTPSAEGVSGDCHRRRPYCDSPASRERLRNDVSRSEAGYSQYKWRNSWDSRTGLVSNWSFRCHCYPTFARQSSLPVQHVRGRSRLRFGVGPYVGLATVCDSATPTRSQQLQRWSCVYDTARNGDGYIDHYLLEKVLYTQVPMHLNRT